jgi:tetratricopeptide (TPR) repeat protein/ribonuclease BN (tRNA processing enzyme)
MAKNSKKTRITDLDVAFSKLFWAARSEHVRLGKKATDVIPAHKAAIAYAHKHNWKWAKDLIEASRLNRLGEQEKALEILEKSEVSIPRKYVGILYFLRGAVLYDNGDLNKAIEAYRSALETPGFEKPAYAWNNLGLSLQAKGEHDEAIKAYRKALDTPVFDKPGNTWNNLGIAFKAKGDIDEAIKAYRNAIETSEYASIEDAWNNLGILLMGKGETGGAIKAFRKALGTSGGDKTSKAWTNLAQAYKAANKVDLARKAFKEALKASDSTGFEHARARAGLKLLDSKLKPAALTPDDRVFIEKPATESSIDDPESRLIGKVKEAGETQYERYLEKLDSNRNDVLSILRGWSSAVTLLEGSGGRWRGGGYFLKWRGFGIVIDPGFDFLRNFHDEGFHGREIAAVIVCHNHPDHNDDLKSIDDLRYELYKRLVGKGGSGSKPYLILWDQDTAAATKFATEHPAHHHEPIVVPIGFPQPVDLSNHAAKLPIRVIPFKVCHSGDVPAAMGMVIELLDKKRVALRIGYTADTAYFEDLPKHLANCDVVIAHISQPTIEELQDATKSKDFHLGYRGVISLLKECQPKLALIGEFWAGYTDLRIDLTKGIRMRSGCDYVLPAGLGMHIKLPSLEIECTECNCATPFTKVKVAPPTSKFGDLAYLCPTCILQ